MQEEDPAGHCGKIRIQQYCLDSRTRPSFPKCVHPVRCSAAAQDVPTKGSISPWTLISAVLMLNYSGKEYQGNRLMRYSYQKIPWLQLPASNRAQRLVLPYSDA